jgi:nucleoside-diphosphate-sugar epimerase
VEGPIVVPHSEEELDELLSRPTPEIIHAVGRFGNRLLLLGAGGKIGPALARMAVRAAQVAGRRDLEVVAVSRFSRPEVAEKLRGWGVRVLVLDLSRPQERSQLPDATEVILLLGYKFSQLDQSPSLRWGLNAYLPAVLAEQYRTARLVCFSSGNVYPLMPVDSSGATEETPPQPVGEYAASVRARELLLEYLCCLHQMAVTILRVNYAVDLRYGVPVDIARKILQRTPISLAMPAVNFVWQGYVNEVALRSFAQAQCPPFLLNVTGPETLRVRDVAERLGERLGMEPSFCDSEEPTALLSNAARCHRLFGLPSISTSQLLEMVASWVSSGKPVWDKPTRFEVRDGQF